MEPVSCIVVAGGGNNSVTSRLLSLLFGFIVMMVTAVSFVTWTELAQCPADLRVSIPFFTVFSVTMCLVLVYPSYLLLLRISIKESPFDVVGTFRNHLGIFNPNNDFEPVITVVKLTVFACIWMISLYAYVKALAFVPAANATVLYAVHSCYVYLFSWIILHVNFIPIRVVAIIFGTTGSILMIYKDGFGTNSMWGSILVPVAASGMAGFKVLFVRVFGRVTTGQYAMFLSITGFYAALLMSPILAALCVTGAENCTAVRWEFVVGASCAYLVFHLVSIFGVLRAHQVFISLGLIFSIPLCAVSDIIWKTFTFSGAEIASAILTVIGFMLNLLPKNWDLTVQTICQMHLHKPKNEPVTSVERRRQSRSTHYVHS